MSYTCPGCGKVLRHIRCMGTHGQWDSSCTSEMKFWGRVDKTSHEGGCWLYMGARDKLGYGDIGFKGRHLQGHRLAWILTHGEPGEMDVLHKCDNPPCCNPAHLYLGTDKDNMRDKFDRGRGANQYARGLGWKREA